MRLQLADGYGTVRQFRDRETGQVLSCATPLSSRETRRFRRQAREDRREYRIQGREDRHNARVDARMQRQQDRLDRRRKGGDDDSYDGGDDSYDDTTDDTDSMNDAPYELSGIAKTLTNLITGKKKDKEGVGRAAKEASSTVMNRAQANQGVQWGTTAGIDNRIILAGGALGLYLLASRR